MKNIVIGIEGTVGAGKTSICRELLNAGFKWPDVTILTEKEVGKRHIVFETKIRNHI